MKRITLFGTALAFSVLVLGVAPTRAHHTGCYLTDSAGPTDKFARGSKAMRWYVPAEGVGFRGTRVYLNAHVHGHQHTCLFGAGYAAGASTGALPNKEWVVVQIAYYNSNTGNWVNAGPHRWFSNTYSTWGGKIQFYNVYHPRYFTKGRARAWYYANGTWSTNYGTLVCTLAFHGQSSYSCS